MDAEPRRAVSDPQGRSRKGWVRQRGTRLPAPKLSQTTVTGREAVGQAIFPVNARPSGCHPRIPRKLVWAEMPTAFNFMGPAWELSESLDTRQTRFTPGRSRISNAGPAKFEEA